MKKSLLLFVNLLLMVIIFTSCSKAPITPTVQTPEDTEQISPEPTEQISPEPTEQISPEPTEQISPEPTEDILSFDEAQDLLINWCEWNVVTYMPDMDKQEEGVQLYGFLVDYTDSGLEWSGETYCYAWVNSSTEMISFEEAGYLEANGPNLYANIPASIFPIPMRDGAVIPYDWFSPPDYVWGVAYMYEDKSVMESYQAQLKKAGFVDYGTVQSVESLWQYEQGDDEFKFTVEMYSEGDMFSMNMYVGY